MIRKVKESIKRYCKFWFIEWEDEEKESTVDSSRLVSGWFPATKDHHED